MEENIDWFKHELCLPDVVKTLQEGEAAYALRKAWYKVYGTYPSDKSLAVLWAKSALETGRWKFIHCYNFGNIKKKWPTKYSPDDGHFFCMYRCGEVLNGKHEMFDPPHFQTHFRGYKTVEDGAEDYLRFVSQQKRYAKAWDKVVQGDPVGYSHELRVAGYYTADEQRYTAGVVRLFDEFMKRKDELLAWGKEEKTNPTASPAEIMHEEFDTVTDNEPPKPEEEIDTLTGNEVPDLKDSRDEITVVETKPVDISKSKTNTGSGGLGFIAAGIVAFAVWVAQHFQGCSLLP